MKDKDDFIEAYESHVLWREYKTKGERLDIRGENIFDIDDKELEVNLEGALYGDTDFTNLKIAELSFNNSSIYPYHVVIKDCEIAALTFSNMNINFLTIENCKITNLRFYHSHVSCLSLDGTSVEFLPIDMSNISIEASPKEMSILHLNRSVLSIEHEVDKYLSSLKRLSNSQIIDYETPFRFVNINSGLYNHVLCDIKKNMYWRGKWYTSDQLMAAHRNGEFGRELSETKNFNLFLQLAIEMGMHCSQQVNDLERDDDEPAGLNPTPPAIIGINPILDVGTAPW